MPGTTYQNVSGGDPPAIPDLTYRGLKTFHEIFYHPSNSRFLTYGNLPLEDHLKQIDESTLKHFTKQEATFDQGNLEKFTRPTEIRFPGPFDSNLPPYHQVALSFLTNEITDAFESFSMKVLSSLLIGGPSSPLYLALIDSQLGTNFTMGTGHNGDFRDTFFSVGVTGVKPDDVDKVEGVVLKTLEEISQKGFPSEFIEAKLSMIELSTKYVRIATFISFFSFLFLFFFSFFAEVSRCLAKGQCWTRRCTWNFGNLELWW